MKKFTLLVWISLICLSSLNAQDKIIVTQLYFDSIKCNILSAADRSIIYSKNGFEHTETISYHNISSCIISKEGDVIISSTVSFDTIIGKIRNIGPTHVQYINLENESVSISKQNIFCIRFEESPYQEKIMEFDSIYKNLILSIHHEPVFKIITDQGIEYNAELIKTDGNQFNVKITDRESPVYTAFQRDGTYVFLFYDVKIRNFEASNQEYILTDEGNFLKGKFKSIDDDQFRFKIDNKSSNLYIEESKQKVAAVFFTDYMNPTKSKRKVDLTASHLEFTFSAGYGFMFAVESDHSNANVEEYLKKIRNGFYINLGLNYYWSKNLGFGAQYKLFKSATTTNPSLIGGSENIYTHFVGISFNYKGRLASQFEYNLIASPGILMFRNKLETNGGKVAIQGNPFAFNISNRFGYINKVGFGVFIEFSYLFSIMKNWSVDNTYYLHNRHENLSRIEFGAGFKYCL